MFTTYGYDTGGSAPGRCSSWMDNGCPAGDSAIEPYVVGHHMLLSHAASVKLYKNKYQVINVQKQRSSLSYIQHFILEIIMSVKLYILRV